MIYEVEGDILLTRARLVVHNVTTFDPMNRGIARKLKDKYPAMAEAFHLWCGEAGAEPGDIWRWEASDHTQMIALITQEGDEDPTRIRRPDKIALHRCLRRLAKEVTATRVKSLAMPRIASGTFGLDWSEVHGMLQSQLGDLVIPIFVYVQELEGQVASEPGM